jgi:hypothetical protein
VTLKDRQFDMPPKRVDWRRVAALEEGLGIPLSPEAQQARKADQETAKREAAEREAVKQRRAKEREFASATRVALGGTYGIGGTGAYGKPLTSAQLITVRRVADRRHIESNRPPDDWQHGPPWERAIWHAYHGDQIAIDLAEATAQLQATMDSMDSITAADAFARHKYMWLIVLDLAVTAMFIVAALVR